MRLRGNYSEGIVEIESNNLDGFGMMKGKVSPEILQPAIFDGIGRFLIGRSTALPPELSLERDFSRNLKG
jgi:hypothetical protein